MKFNSDNMCKGPIFKNIILYTLPIILSGLLQLFFNAADLIVVGTYCGSRSVAAVGSTGSLTGLMVNLFIGLSVGVGVTVAQSLGAGNYKDVHEAVHTAIPLSVLGGAVLTVVGIIFSGTFLGLMGCPEDVLPLSTVYMQIYFGGMIFSMLYNFGSAILRASGDTNGPLIYLTIAGVVNVILNVFFVKFFNMDVAGVALATSISQAISALLVIHSLMRRQDVCRFNIRESRFHKKALINILKIGIPSGIQSSLFAISNVLIQSSINSFGTDCMSGNSAGSSISGFLYTAMNSFNQTTLNFCAQNYGAKNLKRIGLVTAYSLITVSVFGIIAGVAMYLFSEPLLGIYITDSETAIQYGLQHMQYLVLPYFTCGVMDVLTGTLRGLGYSVQPMIITVVGVCVLRIVWLYSVFSLPQCHSYAWLLISYPVSWLATFSCLAICTTVTLKHIKVKFENELTA